MEPSILSEDSRAFDLFVAGGFLILVVVLFSGFLFSDGMLFGTDSIPSGVFLRGLYRDFVRQYHTLPRWDPYILGGLPFIDAMHGDTFYPTSLLKFFMPLHRAMGFKLIVHVFLAGLFMYFLLKAMRLGRYAAAFGGLCYMFACLFVSLVYAGHDAKMFIIALLPLVFLLLERGIDPQEYQVLILPRVLALSDQEAEAMSRYVAGGGHLIADHSPGWFDQHLQGRARPVLDELFGIADRPTAGPGQFFGGRILAELDADKHYRLNFIEAAAKMWPSCRRRDGFVVAERSLSTFNQKRTGSGRASLLNVSVMEYAFLRTFDFLEAENYRAPIEKLLLDAGVKPWVQMRVAGRKPQRVEATYWQQGDRVVLCVVKNPLVFDVPPVLWKESIASGEIVPLEVIFSSPKEDVMDLRTGQKLGDGTEFEIPWTTNEAAMLSFVR